MPYPPESPLLRRHQTPDKHVINSFIFSEQGFTPLNIAGCQLWLKAGEGIEKDDGSAGYTAVTADGDGIKRWLDNSGNGNAATQATSGAQPAFVSGAVNGHPVIRFDGDDWLATPITTAFSDFVIFIAFVDSGGNSPAARLIDKDYVGGFWLGRSVTDDQWGGGVKETTAPYGIFTEFSSGAHVLSSMRSGATHSVFGDGEFRVSNSVDAGALNNAQVAIGVESPSSSQISFGKVDIAEVLIYDRALSDDQRQSVEDYLGTKYGITITH